MANLRICWSGYVFWSVWKHSTGGITRILRRLGNWKGGGDNEQRLYIYGLFNDSFNSSDCIASSGRIVRCIMNWQGGGMWQGCSHIWGSWLQVLKAPQDRLWVGIWTPYLLNMIQGCCLFSSSNVVNNKCIQKFVTWAILKIEKHIAK